MDNQPTVRKHFRWRALLIRFLVNAVTLLIVVAITPSVYFVDPSLLNLLLLALVLGILNATLKPIIQFFTLPFIFVSYGLIIVLINSLMIWMLSWIFPGFLAVDSLFWALVAGALYGIISVFLESLCGLGEPIVPDDTPEEIALRERLDAEAVSIIGAYVDEEEAKEPTAAALAKVTTEENNEGKGEEERAQDQGNVASPEEEPVEEEAESIANRSAELLPNDVESDSESDAVSGDIVAKAEVSDSETQEPEATGLEAAAMAEDKTDNGVES
jgi:putative membrane protein